MPSGRYIDPDCTSTYWWEVPRRDRRRGGRTKFNLSRLCSLEWHVALCDGLTSRIHLSPFVEVMPTTYNNVTRVPCKCLNLTKGLNFGEIYLCKLTTKYGFQGFFDSPSNLFKHQTYIAPFQWNVYTRHVCDEKQHRRKSPV